MRIVTLLPAATEIVCALGLGHSLVGISHECDYPVEQPGELPHLTSSRLASDLSSQQIDQEVRDLSQQSQALFELDVQRLVALRPDLIISQSLCDVCAIADHQVQAAVEQLSNKPQLLRLGPLRLAEMLDDILRVGTATAALPVAERVVTELRSRVERIGERARKHQLEQPLERRPSVILLEWIEPLFSAGHWNPELIQLAGAEPVLAAAGQKSRQLDWEEVLSADPDFLLVACCGLSIDRTLEDLPRLVSYRNFGKLKCISQGQVFLVDGSQYFNRPGPRLVDSLEILAHALDSQLHPLPPHLEPAVRMQRAPN